MFDNLAYDSNAVRNNEVLVRKTSVASKGRERKKEQFFLAIECIYTNGRELHSIQS